MKFVTNWAPPDGSRRVLWPPGRRTFRLAAEAGRAQSFIWLEKEQLFQLGIYLQQAVQQLGESALNQESAPGEAPWTGDAMEQDFQARQMQLQYDREANCFIVHAFEGDEDDPDSGGRKTSVSFWMTMAPVGGAGQPGAERIAPPDGPPVPVRYAHRPGRAPLHPRQRHARV